MICKLCLCALLVSSSFGFIIDTFFGSPPKTVEQLDVDKYLGRWYQVYASQSVMTLYERGAVCVTADYTNGTDGKITVLNSENLNTAEGHLKVIHGYVTRSSEPGKLTVHLEGVPAGGDYWIIKLGPTAWGPKQQYQYYIVSDKIRGQLFVLARDPAVFKRDYEAEVLQFLQQQSFTHFYNKPVLTYHGPDCMYNRKHQ